MPAGELIWLRAETFIHAGVGQQASVVDLPFAREGATGYPYIPGSGVKGALRDAYWLGKRGATTPWPTGAEKADEEKAAITNPLFGKGDGAGKILFSDARLAFLPVRTLGDTYRYVTSAGLLRRLRRDLEFVQQSWQAPSLSPGENEIFAPPGSGKIFLEEFPFDAKPLNGFTAPCGLAKVETELRARIAILHDGAFDYFARHGLFVRQRNALEAATKTAKGTALWSEESLPPDTLMYVVLTPRLPHPQDALNDIIRTLHDKCGCYFQAGGNETVGEGWFKMLNLPGAGQGQGAPGAPQTVVEETV